MNTRHRLVFLVLPLIALASGCSEATSFNAEMSGLTKELEQAGKKFGEQLALHMGNPEKLQDDYADMVGEVGHIVKRAKAMKIPALKGAKEYHEAFLEFIDFEESMVDRDGALLVKQAGRRDREGLLETVQRTSKREKKELELLKTAQKEFAKANNLTVQE